MFNSSSKIHLHDHRFLLDYVRRRSVESSEIPNKNVLFLLFMI